MLKKDRGHSKRSGFAGYVVVSVMVSLLFILTQSFTSIVHQESEIGEVGGNLQQAYYCAESGVQMAIANLKLDPYLYTNSEKRFRITHREVSVDSGIRFLRSDWITLTSNKDGSGSFYVKSWNAGTATHYIKSQGKFVPRDVDGNFLTSSPVMKQVWAKILIATDPKSIKVIQFGETGVQVTNPATLIASFDLGVEITPSF